MAKRKFRERYTVEVRHKYLRPEQSEYARKTMERILKDVPDAEWFSEDLSDEKDTVRYIFRTRLTGKLVQEALDAERDKFTDAYQVWSTRGWVQSPPRNQLGLYIDIGLVAVVAPGDTISWMHCQEINGVPTIGYFNNHRKSESKQMGHIQRLLFHGRSVDVWRAKRRFRYEYNNWQSKHHRDFDYALGKAREQLSDESAIHVVNVAGDVYSITRHAVLPSSYITPQNGRALGKVFEYEFIPLGLTRDEVVRPLQYKTAFESELAHAVSSQKTKRIASGLHAK